MNEEKHKKTCWNWNYFEHLLFFFAVTGCVWISAFPSSVGVPVGIAISSVGIKYCAITAGIKHYQSIIKKN